MKKDTRTILVTIGLPYANGPLHLGHTVESIQADIWVRFQKMCHHDCIYVCATDSHGTPIMIKAEKDGIDPETLVKQMQLEHAKDYEDFHIHFDNYYTTHSQESRELTELFYNRLKKRGDITERTIEQAYDSVKKMFLPDRYVKGECPQCGAKNQYGDSCDCGATYSPMDLKNPISVLSGTTPITKTSEHYFFQLPNYEEALKKWTRAEHHLQEQIVNKLNEWFEQGLKDWDISRDAPYFGFEIPEAKDKYFYVWLDAPIGYIASFKNLCDRRDDLNFDDYWGKDSTVELYHFIGKDIVYFHALFWIAVLMGVGFRTPTAIFVHGFLTVDGQKLSKSKGTFINARTYLDYLDPEYLRYYFASKLSSRIEDIDLNFEDFRLKVNSDLVGKIVNLASRCASFINKHFNGQLSKTLNDTVLIEEFIHAAKNIANDYENREYSHAIREIMALADKANQHVDEHKPWELIKEENRSQKVQDICTIGINLFRILMIYLKPILPKLAEKSEEFLDVAQSFWEDHKTILTDHKINTFKPLMQRVETDRIEALKQTVKQEVI
jgi:methionyl-tRNA synthetase